MTSTNLGTGGGNRQVRPSDWPGTARDWITVLSIGLFVGIDNVVFAVAIGALLFSGQLVGGVEIAVAASILSTFVAATGLALFSQIRCNIGHVQDVGVAVLAQTLAVTVAAQTLPEEARVATALFIVVGASLASALLLWLTGYMGWGRIARFFPQSVLAGFLAGTGWLLAAGGVSVASGLAMADMFRVGNWTAKAALNAVPALVFGIILLLALRRIAWKWTLIAFMIFGTAGFHLCLWGFGIDLEAAQAIGWLPRLDGHVSGIPNLAGYIGQVNWPTVLAAAPAIATVAFLTLVGTLLNTSALANITKQDVDPDAELRVTGILNAVIALFAGPPAHTGIASSTMTLKGGVSQRGTGLIVAAVALFSLFNAASLISALPLFVTAGLIIYLGIDFLSDWLIRTYQRYSREEWSVVAIIVAIVILFGFAEAIIAGFFIASLIFAWNYASVPVLRRTGSLRDRSSTLARPPLEAAWLRDHGDSVEMVELQGYMFFGTADRLHDHVARRIADTGRTRLTRLIVDFQHVVGLDAAAATQLGRIVTLAGQHGFDLVFSGYPKTVLATLTRAAPSLLADGGALSLPALDEALEQAEDALLAGAPPSVRMATTMLERLAPDPADLPLLERLFASLPREHFARDSVLLSAGARADCLLFLDQGRVVIRAPAPDGAGPRLRVMSSGAILGEIGLALNAVRTADVIADTDVVALRLTVAQMQQIEQTDPALSHALYRLQRRSLAETIIFDKRFERTRS